MSWLASWLLRVPLWLWLFLTATQVLNLIAGQGRIATLERIIATTDQRLHRFPDLPDLVEFRELHEKLRRDEQFHLAGAAVLAPTFLALSVWRWTRGRKRACGELIPGQAGEADQNSTQA